MQDLGGQLVECMFGKRASEEVGASRIWKKLKGQLIQGAVVRVRSSVWIEEPTRRMSLRASLLKFVKASP